MPVMGNGTLTSVIDLVAALKGAGFSQEHAENVARVLESRDQVLGERVEAGKRALEERVEAGKRAFEERVRQDIDTHLATKVDIAEVKMEVAGVKKEVAEMKGDLAQKMLYSFVATVAVLGGLISVLEFRRPVPVLPDRLLDSLERIERRLPPPAGP